MAERRSLPTRFESMSLEELHGQIRPMEQLLRLLKKKARYLETSTTPDDTEDDYWSVRNTNPYPPGKERCIERLNVVRSEALTQPGKIRTFQATNETHSWAWQNSQRWLSLKPREYKRYGRQMIMPEVGLSGQLALKNARVLIVGVGGLGSPAAAYLAAAGVGVIGLVDGDKVERSNLHRQILHNTDREGMEKVDSAEEFLQSLNTDIEVVTHPLHLSSENAIETLIEYDVVLDCTDRLATRYLVSDAAVMARIPLVHGSALQTEGQLMVLNNPPRDMPSERKGPCYRCIWPRPPPPQSILTCGEGGILGPVVGVIGVLMAMETLKILIPTLQKDYSAAANFDHNGIPFLMYSACFNPPFRSLRMRGLKDDCFACRKGFDKKAVKDYDYDGFCGVACPLNILPSEERMDPKTYHAIPPVPRSAPTLVDVRENTQFNMVHIEDTINVPWSEIRTDPSKAFRSVNEHLQNEIHNSNEIRFICRFGNDSQLAVRQFRELQQTNPDLEFKCAGDIRGGLKAWREQVDPDFPDY